MNHAYLITGGNIGRAAENLATAARLLGVQCGAVIDRSAIYETEPWGKPDQPNFLNQVLVIETVLTAREVMKVIMNIEREMGRERKEKNGPRVIDIDILLFNHQVVRDPDLVIPHPHFPERRFVLVPLCEVAPAYIHPILFKTIQQLLNECTDELKVKKIEA